MAKYYGRILIKQCMKLNEEERFNILKSYRIKVKKYWINKAIKDVNLFRELLWFFSKIKRIGDKCWEWTASKKDNGSGQMYGQASFLGKKWTTHRISYRLFLSRIPDELFVCHTCDNHGCCNPCHLYLGTHQDNMDDMAERERQQSGENHWTRRMPEKITWSGDNNWTRKYPEKISRGEKHSKACVKGDDHWTRKDSSKIRGDNNGMRKHSEKVLRGEKHPRHKLSFKQIKKIRKLYATGKYTYQDLANRFKISKKQIGGLITLQRRIND